MRRPPARTWLLLLAAAAVAATCRPVGAQPNLGNRLPGTVGLDAGAQIPPGLYVADRFIYYDAIHLRDRDGEIVSSRDFDIDAAANAVGVAIAWRIHSGLHVGGAVAVPFVWMSAPGPDPSAELDRFGLGDAFVSPVRIGWRWAQADVVGSYGVYAPTRQFEREGIGAPQWSHQLSAGGTLYFDRLRRGRLSMLASYDLYHRKVDIDVTRGDSLQLQGGIGTEVFGVLELGLAAYALWQVEDDRGRDLPPALRGRREVAYGLGPEVNAMIPALRAKLGLRYVRDLGVRGRPEGQLVVVSLSFRLWAQPSS